MSGSTFSHPLLRMLGWLVLLAGAAWSAQAAPVEVVFSSNAGIGGTYAQDGQGGSADVPGLTLQVFNASNAAGTPVPGITWKDNTWLASGDNSWSGLTHTEQDGLVGMVVRSANGSNFSITSFRYYNWGADTDNTYVVEGYLDGALVGTRNFSIPFAMRNPVTITLLPAAFRNVDEIRIRLTGGGTDPGMRTWHSINNIIVEPINTAPTDLSLSATSLNQSAGQNGVTGTLSTTDADAGDVFTYSLVSGSGDTGNAQFNIQGNVLRANDARNLPAGSYSVRVRSTDSGGASVEKAFTITVTDDLAPSVSSIALSGSPAPTASSVAYLVTFSEAVVTPSSADFILTATGSAAGTVGTITGTGSNVLTVAVDNITGTGTLRLDLKAASGITDTVGNGNIAAYSSGAAHTVAIPTAPGAPGIGTPTPGNGQVSVAFTAPASDGGSAITGYTVTASPGGFTATGAASPLLVSGLSNGTAYTFTVTATNASGTSAASAASAAVTPKAAQTISFGNPGTQNFGTSPTLTASSSAGLLVRFSSATTGVCTITSGGTLTFITGGTCSIDANQDGNASVAAAPQVSQTFSVAAVVPGTPTIGTATAGDSQATVTFTAPASNGGAPITVYTVTASPGGITATGIGSPIILTGLSNGTAYVFTVTATNSAGTGAASGASMSITPAAAQVITFANPGAQNFGTTPTLSATSSSGLAPTFTSTTTGVCTITSGGMLTFISAGTCSIQANQAGDGGYLPASTVTQAFQVNAVAPAAPGIGTATPSGTGEIEVSFTAPASNGGSAITGYTVTATPGGITATGTGSPVRVTGLTVGQSYTFTVTATNSAGTGLASTASNAATAADAIVANASSATVAYGMATPITLDIGGIATSVSVTSPAAHGVVTVNGITVSYTPAAGYAGPDAFSYRATDGNTTSAAAVVSVTVSPPTLSLAPTTLVAGTAGSSYQQALTTSGGAAPYTYQALGPLPAGITLGANGEFSGTPTTAGSYGIPVQVTDSSTGTGPFTGTRTYTLVVAAPQIAFSVPSLPQPFTAASYNQRLQVSGGAAPYTFAVTGGVLPTGLTLASDGLLSGAAAAAGSYAFDVTVTDANGFTASQSFTMVVIEAAQQISAFVANPTAPTYSVNGRFAVSATGGASGNPVVFATTTPTVCRVDGNTVLMLTAGRCSLTANQAGNAQYQAAAQATLDVDITAAVPVLQWAQELQKLYGEAAFDLIDPVSPSRGGFSYSSSAPNVASVQGRTVTLHGEGVAIITVTQAASGGFAPGSAQLRLTVTQRPDPTRDPGVVAGVQAQVDASVRFASAQQSNIRDRLRQVRSGDNGSSNQLALGYAGGRDRPGLAMPLAPMQAAPWPSLPTGWGLWASGNATFGDGDRSSSYAFHTDGLSVGLDRAVGERLLLGVAASLARNDSKMDGSDSRVEGRQHSLAAYGLWRSGEHLFVDGVIAGGALDFDTRRWSNDVDAFARGSRDGDQWFGSLAFGYEHRNAGMTLTGYGRVEASRTTLDAYRETGLDLYDLDYRRQVVRNSAVALGLEGAYVAGDGEGRVRPFWSIEYRQAIDDKGAAYLNYVVGPRAHDYRLDMQSYNDNALSVAAGMDVRLQRGWLLSLLLGHEQTRGSSRASSVGLRVSYGGAGGGVGAGAMGAADAEGAARGTPPRCPPRRCDAGNAAAR
ncbi:autotransporter domain-containing protein [Stenotrophomonas sp.]|uniref:autotransporter domain-containing protein n=1 Tax=Stenotrophomonas sp. TaxID=69392 RepID=UPI00289E66A2|nr:autotransporter domain-containing protein [Stenotrophomonas sp.]